MKYSKDEILYFKPSYNEQIKYCRICQIVKYLENTKANTTTTKDTTSFIPMLSLLTLRYELHNFSS